MSMRLDTVRSCPEELLPPKAAGLRMLSRIGLRIPETWVLIDEEHFDTILEEPAEELEQLFEHHLDTRWTYAVRSAASAEDEPGSMTAGIYDSFLSVRFEDLIQRVRDVARSYLRDRGQQTEASAVLIQRMVEPLYSGVIFTQDPLGRSRGAVVEYINGLGSLLVEHGEEPRRVRYLKGRLIGDHEMGPEMRRLLRQVCKQAARASRHSRGPLDCEWAIDGQHLYFLQARRFLTQSVSAVYDRKIAQNFLPGLIKPLVWDVNGPLVNGAWLRLIESLVGRVDLEPQRMAALFSHRAYFNMGELGIIFRKIGFREDFLQQLMGIDTTGIEVPFRPTVLMITHIGRVLRFIVSSQMRFAHVQTFCETFHQRSLVLGQRIDAAASITELKGLYEELYGHMSIAAEEKILLPLIASIRRRGYLRSLQNGRGCVGASNYLMQEALYDPGSFAQYYGDRIDTETKELFARRFGFMSENSNDFSLPTWSEDPALLESILSSLRSTEGSSSDFSRGSRRQKRRADRIALKVSQLSHAYGYGYSLFRRLFMRWGELLVERNVLQDPGQIFFRRLEHVFDTESKSAPYDLSALADEVRESYLKAEELELPMTIFGEEPPIPLDPHGLKSLYTGLPVSSGRVEGKIKVVKTLKGQPEVSSDSIVVIPSSDMGFTPLLSQARAVIMASGGMLGHIAIQARERGIPALTSVEGVLKIPDGTHCILDCYEGTVRCVEAAK